MLFQTVEVRGTLCFPGFMSKIIATDELYQIIYVACLSQSSTFRWSCVPLMYPATFLFKEASAAYVFLAVFNIFVGVSFLFVTFMLDYFRSNAVGTSLISMVSIVT